MRQGRCGGASGARPAALATQGVFILPLSDAGPVFEVGVAHGPTRPAALLIGPVRHARSALRVTALADRRRGVFGMSGDMTTILQVIGSSGTWWDRQSMVARSRRVGPHARVAADFVILRDIDTRGFNGVAVLALPEDTSPWHEPRRDGCERPVGANGLSLRDRSCGPRRGFVRGRGVGADRAGRGHRGGAAAAVLTPLSTRHIPLPLRAGEPTCRV